MNAPNASGWKPGTPVQDHNAMAGPDTVTGNRAPIATLWIAYANQLDGGTSAVDAAVTAAPAAPEMTVN